MTTDLFELAPPQDADDTAGAAGHRQRLRARFLAAGPEALADHEVLELLLFALPRRDTKPLARMLLARFGSFAGAIAAPAQDLRAVEGLGEAGVASLKLVHAAALRLLRADILDQPVLGHWDRLMEYLQAELSRERIEQFRVLFLDNRNRLIADEAQQRGTVNHTQSTRARLPSVRLSCTRPRSFWCTIIRAAIQRPLARSHHDTSHPCGSRRAIHRAAQPYRHRQRPSVQLPARRAAIAAGLGHCSARQSDPLHDAALTGVVIHRVVLHTAIVPDRQCAWGPAEPAGEFRPDLMTEQELQ